MVGKKSPLHDWHAANSAQFMEFGGWLIPEAYGKVDMEYAALRNGTGLVDLCHEARYRVEGQGALQFLNAICTNNLDKLEVRKATYAFLCNVRGGIMDAVTVYRDENYFLLLGNCTARSSTIQWLEAQAQSFDGPSVAVHDVTNAQGQISVRGPGAGPMMDRVAFGQRMSLEPGQAMVATIGTARSLVIRRLPQQTDGYDVITGAIYLQPLWDKFADAARQVGARPIGHQAREIFRLESGLPRHGSEIDESTLPQEISQVTQVDFFKKYFVGRRALLHASSAEYSRTLVATRFEHNAPVDASMELMFESLPVGRVTSSVISPMMRCRLAMGFVNSLVAKPGTTIRAMGRDGQVHTGEIVKLGLQMTTK